MLRHQNKLSCKRNKTASENNDASNRRRCVCASFSLTTFGTTKMLWVATTVFSYQQFCFRWTSETVSDLNTRKQNTIANIFTTNACTPIIESTYAHLFFVLLNQIVFSSIVTCFVLGERWFLPKVNSRAVVSSLVYCSRRARRFRLVRAADAAAFATMRYSPPWCRELPPRCRVPCLATSLFRAERIRVAAYVCVRSVAGGLMDFSLVRARLWLFALIKHFMSCYTTVNWIQILVVLFVLL